MSYRNLFLVFLGLSLNVFHGFAQGFSSPPIATNTVNTVRFNELNLKSSDYSVLSTVTETALIAEERGRRGYTISCEEEGFRLEFEYDKDDIVLKNWDGIIKMGFLANNIPSELKTPKDSYDIANKLAVYKLINTAQMQGADGVIEPIISINMARNGNVYYYKATVSGKLIKLNVK